MGFWQRLFGYAGTKSSTDATGIVVGPEAIWVYVRCDKCGEPIAVRLSKMSVLQREEMSPDCDWFVNKTIVGSQNRCFNRMELHLEFDLRFCALKKELSGGTFISKEEYEKTAAHK